MKKWTSSFGLTLLMALLLAGPQTELQAQQNFPARSIRPDERITLDSSLPLKTAIDILSQYSMKHEGKIIIDTAGKNTPINVQVNNMYWKRALEYILRSNLLKYEERERHYEVVLMIDRSREGEGTIITTTTPEIEINAIFFEADYATVTEAGIDWSAMDGGRVAVNGNFAGLQSGSDFTTSIERRYGRWDVFALFRAIESLNKGEVIANPQIKVIDGQSGKIKVGQNFFLTTEDFAGNTRFQEYEAGIILTVTPTILGGPDSTFIHLTLRAERSNVVPAAEAVTKSITESDTKVLLLSGEETVIAGLFSNQITEIRRGIPLLKDLPPWFFGLRYLFGFNSTSVTKKELIIILQANIMPTVADRIAARSLNRKIYIDQKRQEFQRRLRQLKTLSSSNNRSSNSRSTTKRRR